MNRFPMTARAPFGRLMSRAEREAPTLPEPVPVALLAASAGARPTDDVVSAEEAFFYDCLEGREGGSGPTPRQLFWVEQRRRSFVPFIAVALAVCTLVLLVAFVLEALR